ncbi:MAG TPA: hypothetical protein VGJ19_08265 [Streptosporangiaceae bacterium]
MTEPNGMSCGEFDDVAAELALGVLTGRERAEAVGHLDECDSCREHVRQLSLTGEEMLGLLPSREPSQGFESRVMDRLGVATKRKRPNWSRRMLTTAAVALAVVACGIGGWGLRGATGPASGGGSTAEAPLREATLLTAAHQKAGKIYIYDGNPRWLYMGVDARSAGNDTVICQLVARGGRVITIGSFKLDGGYGTWGSPDPVGAGDVTGARMMSMNGKVLATATFKTSS